MLLDTKIKARKIYKNGFWSLLLLLLSLFTQWYDHLHKQIHTDTNPYAHGRALTRFPFKLKLQLEWNHRENGNASLVIQMPIHRAHRLTLFIYWDTQTAGERELNYCIRAREGQRERDLVNGRERHRSYHQKQTIPELKLIGHIKFKEWERR